MKKAVIILSGGMDSVTLLYSLLDQGYNVSPITFDYGQKHKKEIECAKQICTELKLTHKIVDLSALNDLAPSSQTRAYIAVPEGKYDDDNMKMTVVPNRNMVMIALAASYAISINASEVYYGAHAGDHAIYPDCREPFVRALNQALSLCDWNPVRLKAPFIHLTKGQIVMRGLALGIDYAKTWTCYKGEDLSCGVCGSCTERLEAFAFAGGKDPLKYIGAK